MSVLDQNKPHQFYFEETCKIPHGSKNEKALSDYLVEFAKKHQLAYEQDELHNVIIYKSASKGYEDHPGIMMQAHIDMVCEKNQDVEFDFEKDPLNLFIEDGFLKAKGTTLGADDGVGTAYMMAILADPQMPHPALECIFTTQEEIGMFGAIALDKTKLKTRRLINLDGGGETQTLISSAGGNLCHLHYQGTRVGMNAPTYKVLISGLKGGHSGGEVDKERGNANKLLMRILYQLMKDYPLNLIEIVGGLKENAIPREAYAIFACDMEESQLQSFITKMGKEIQRELISCDAGVIVQLQTQEKIEMGLSLDDSKAVVTAMYLMPNGMRQRDLDLSLVITSLNVGVMDLHDGIFKGEVSMRSALDSSLVEMMSEVDLICELFHFDVSYSSRYPGWAFEKESVMREKLKEVFQSIYHQDLKLLAVHGGCECGLFKEIDESMDIVTIGPITNDIHTPQEALNIDSFDRTYHLLTSYLKEL